MADKGAHPGVRSLLARFENNNQNSTSPPSRGRSPVDSENSDSRPLSKVRASFIAVNGATQSGPVAGLRSTSSRSDSPVAPPSRVRSFNSDDLNTPLKSPLSSPISNGLGNEETSNEPKSGEMVETAITQAISPGASRVKEVASSHNKENEPASTVVAAPSPKKMQTVTKRPSTIQVDKTASINTSVTKSTSSTGLKSPAHPRTPTSPAKPDLTKVTRPARSPRPPAARDSPKAVTAKPSRTSLNTAVKPAARPPRSSMPAREATKSTASNAPRTTKPEPRPPTKPARLPASATTPTLSSAARGGPIGVTTSSLSRKPGSLKSGTHRTTTPTASSVRKQTSQPSLQRQPANERPHSRMSNTSSKAVDEGFLARMMRPTASSANKAHDKVEVRSPPRPSRASRASVRPVAAKMEAPKPSRPTKANSVIKKPQEKPQPAHTEKEEAYAEAVNPEEEEDVAHTNFVEPQAALADEPASTVVDSLVETTETELATEEQSEDVPAEPSTKLEEPVQAAEVPEEQTMAAPLTQEPTTAVEAVDAQSVEPSDLPSTGEAKEQTSVDSLVAIAEENAADMNVKPDDLDVDVGKLSLN